MNKNTNLTNLQRKLAFWTRLDNLLSVAVAVLAVALAATYGGTLMGAAAGFIVCSVIYRLGVLPKAYKALDRR